MKTNIQSITYNEEGIHGRRRSREQALWWSKVGQGALLSETSDSVLSFFVSDRSNLLCFAVPSTNTRGLYGQLLYRKAGFSHLKCVTWIPRLVLTWKFVKHPLGLTWSHKTRQMGKTGRAPQVAPYLFKVSDLSSSFSYQYYFSSSLLCFECLIFPEYESVVHFLAFETQARFVFAL